ncbi:MAG: sigma-70 family RNA polymerase sigma factor [Planctomycetota bacterium]
MDSTNPELLLDHGPFLRGLATALLHDRNDADDVVQTAYQIALTKAPRSGWPMPQWLAGVTRNLARRTRRDRVRRGAREQAVAAAPVSRPTDEVVAREELRREVVAAVLALEEPSRSVVLLCYYDGLPPREIAARMGMPAATVRSHLHRALGRLRTRLDREQREERPAWRALLLPLVGANEAPVATPRGTRWLKVVAASCVIAVGAVLVRPMFDGVTPTTDTRADAAPGPAPERVSVTVLPPEREAAPPAATSVPVAPPAPAMHLRFVESDGTAVVGEALRARFAAGGTAPSVLAVSDEELTGGGIDRAIATMAGELAKWTVPCTCEFADDGTTVRGLPASGRHRVLVARPGAAPFTSPAFELPLAADVAFEIALPPPTSLRTVRLVDRTSHAALANATVRIYVEFGDDRAYVPVTAVQADERGECRLSPHVVANPSIMRPPIFWAETPTHAARFQVKEGNDVQEVQVAPRGRVEGIAYDLDAKAAADRTVVVIASKGPATRIRCDAQGRFAADGLPATRSIAVLHAVDPADCIVAQASVKSGATTVLAIGSASPGATVTGRVTAGGAPVPGLTVMFAARGDGRSMATTRADGTYRLRGVRGEGSVWLVCGDPTVSDDFGVRATEASEPAPGSAHVFDFDLPAGVVRVEVLDETTGGPVAGAAVQADPVNAAAMTERFPGFRYRPGWAERSGADGAATMRCLPPGEGVTLRVGGPGFVTRTIDVPVPAADEKAPAIEVRIRRSE